MVLNNLKVQREQSGFTQEELARKIGKTSRTVQTYEKGGGVRKPLADKIARVLGCAVKDLEG